MSWPAVARWLIEQPERERSPEQFFEAFAGRLCDEGLPLWRLSGTLISFDPAIVGAHISWIAGQGTDVALRTYDVLQQPMYTNSPVAHVISTGTELRCRIDVPDEQLRYPVFAELKQKGATDFFIIPLWVGDALTSSRFRHVVATGQTWMSFTTREPGGFTEAQLDGLRSIRAEIALRIALETSKDSARSLLRAYLGANAARRVLEGAFLRGSAEAIRAAIWYCDMRGFTTLSDAAPPHQVVKALDRYFDCVATPIESHGGEVLKFIGDAVLAIFQFGDAEDACARAMKASREAVANLASLRAEPGAPQLGCGVALHVGEVYYGNIGTRARLDFTVIGAAVNEVCRVEALTRALGVDILLTEAFVRAARIDGARSLGRHALKGVSDAPEVFTLPP